MRFSRHQRKKSYAPARYNSWREYQDHLQKSQKPIIKKRWAAGVLVFAGACLSVFLIMQSYFSAPADGRPSPASAIKEVSEKVLISKNDIRILLKRSKISKSLDREIRLPFKNQMIHIETSIDSDLQTHLIDAMDLKNSRFIGVVAMEAHTGRIHALAGFNAANPEKNPCLINEFPAASLFKIVTAAAAVDYCGYNSYTKIQFNGYKHTLYKKQLKEQENRYTNTMMFKDAFAQSVNPVFGKLGALYLKRSELEEYAKSFGFNQLINFELPVGNSHIQIEDDTYQRAEIASGFNNETTISPLHAAMMVSAVLNDGNMVEPSLIEKIADEKGGTLYKSKISWHGRAMSPKASKVLIRLMETTIQSGTGKKTFRNYRHHQILSQLKIGGKTGSISNHAQDTRFDWFVGFANDKKGDGPLIVAAMVGHGDYIGKRAAEYAKIAMSHYFQHHFAQQEKISHNSGS